MFEDLGFVDSTARDVSVWFGLLLGLTFGFLAEKSKFCFRRSVIRSKDQKQALGVWMVAFAFAIIGTQTAVYYDIIDFSENRYYAANPQYLAIAVGGIALGVGMVLTRGCPSRITVLMGTGNLRAVLVAIVFSITVLSMLKGFLAPIRLFLSQFTTPTEVVGFRDLPGDIHVWGTIIILPALAYGIMCRAHKRDLIMGALIGLCTAGGWIGTGFILFDEFDPIAMQSLGATLPWSEALFWFVASSSIPLNFGCGIIGGMILGGFLGAVTGGRFNLQGFDSAQQTARYFVGAVLMGIGGGLAGGCTVGSGLTGMSTLSFAAVIAILSIGIGGIFADRVIDG